MGTINLGPPVGENSRFELEVRLDPDNGCRIVPPQRGRGGKGGKRFREGKQKWKKEIGNGGRSQSRRPKVSGVELQSRGRGRFVGGRYKRVSRRIEDRGVSFADA